MTRPVDPAAIEKAVLAELTLLGRASASRIAARLGLDPYLVQVALDGPGLTVVDKGGLYQIAPVRWGVRRPT